MNEAMIKDIVSHVVGQYLSHGSGNKSIKGKEIPVEASGRHVHLSEMDIHKLFGEGYKLTPKKAVSQPGQYVSEEKVTIVGPKRKYENVAVLGPPRELTQVEISQTDAMFLGLDAPVAMSGELSKAADIKIVAENGSVNARKSTIVAKNHLHISDEEAQSFGLKDGDEVDITMMTNRPITFNNVNVRAGKNHNLAMHIDYDEANACDFKNGDKGIVITEKEMICLEKEHLSEEDILMVTHYLSEMQIKDAVKDGYESVAVKKGTIISPLAKDYASKYSVKIRFI